MVHQFFLPYMAAQAKEHIKMCHLCLAFKAKQPKAPLENIMATHPLELVHLDYLCLEPGKGLEENVLVVTDHFTRYAQAYVTRTQTAQITAKTLWDKYISTMGYLRRSCQIRAKPLKVSWWLTSVQWWECKRYGPVHTICKLMANVRGSAPLWLVCWECYPQRRNQSGRTTLECWFTPIIVPEIQLRDSAPTTSCMGDNPTFQ